MAEVWKKSDKSFQKSSPNKVIQDTSCDNTWEMLSTKEAH